MTAKLNGQEDRAKTLREIYVRLSSGSSEHQL